MRQIAAGKQSRTFLIVVSPVVDLPKELEKQFAVIEHQLPGRDELEEIARGTACEEGDMPEGDQLGLLLDAAAGMTRLEAENTFALSLVRHGRLDSRTVFEQKAQLLAKGNRALALHEGQETFADIGGLDYLKTYCLETLSVREANPKVPASWRPDHGRVGQRQIAVGQGAGPRGRAAHVVFRCGGHPWQPDGPEPIAVSRSPGQGRRDGSGHSLSGRDREGTQLGPDTTVTPRAG